MVVRSPQSGEPRYLHAADAVRQALAHAGANDVPVGSRTSRPDELKTPSSTGGMLGSEEQFEAVPGSVGQRLVATTERFRVR